MDQITTPDELMDALDLLVQAIATPAALDNEQFRIYWDRTTGRAHWEA